MSFLEQVKKGKVIKPLVLVIYGPSGVGKSTFGSEMKAPVYLGAEDGANNLDVARFPQVRSFADCMAAVKELTEGKHDFQTLVVDSLDWIEPLVNAEVCAKAGVQNIEEIGYGKGHIAALKLWQDFVHALGALREKRGMHLCLIAHAQIKPVNDPKETRQYDRYSLKLHEKASALFTEFADAVLFATFEVYFKTAENNKAKAQTTGLRVMHTVWKPWAVAKSRFNLPETLPLSFEALEAAIKADAPKSLTELAAIFEALVPQVKDPTTATKAREHAKRLEADASGFSKLVARLEAVVSQQQA